MDHKIGRIHIFAYACCLYNKIWQAMSQILLMIHSSGGTVSEWLRTQCGDRAT